MEVFQKTAVIETQSLPAMTIKEANVEVLQQQALPAQPAPKSNNAFYYVLGALGLVVLFSMSKKSTGSKKTTKK